MSYAGHSKATTEAQKKLNETPQSFFETITNRIKKNGILINVTILSFFLFIAWNLLLLYYAGTNAGFYKVTVNIFEYSGISNYITADEYVKMVWNGINFVKNTFWLPVENFFKKLTDYIYNMVAWFAGSKSGEVAETTLGGAGQLASGIVENISDTSNTLVTNSIENFALDPVLEIASNPVFDNVAVKNSTDFISNLPSTFTSPLPVENSTDFIDNLPTTFTSPLPVDPYTPDNFYFDNLPTTFTSPLPVTGNYKYIT